MNRSNDASVVLGPVVQEHRIRWTYLLAVVAGGVFFTLAGILGGVQAVRRALTHMTDETIVVGLLTTVPFLLAGAGLLFWAARRLRKVVTLHQGGFHYRDARGEWVVPWHAVDGVYQKIVRVYRAGVEVDVRDVYTVALQGGQTIEVDYHLDGVDKFGYELTTEVTRYQLPGYRQAFAAGHPVEFGQITIDRNGISTDGKSLSWYEVESLSWKAGILSADRAFLQIKRVGGLLAWAKVPMERVKNYHVLMAIAADIGKAA